MSKLLILQGIPGSGKTTLAKELEAQGWVRVNKDDIRAKLAANGWVWSHKNEERDVIPLRNDDIRKGLGGGYNVVSDDTNFGKHVQVLTDIGRLAGAEVSLKLVDTPLEECIRRNSGRPAPIDSRVIIDMHTKYIKKAVFPMDLTIVPYVPDPALPSVVICDLDGTLCLHNNRSPFDYDKCDTDLVNEPVLSILKAMNGHYVSPIYCSGREDVARNKTQKWLDDHYCPEGPLFMRPARDFRKDSIVKLEIFDTYIRFNYNVKFVLDDRDQVIKMWRSLGLTCLQVNYGAF